MKTSPGEPIFSFGDGLNPSSLVEGQAELAIGSERFNGSAKIRLVIQPRPHIDILVALPAISQERQFIICSGAEEISSLSFDGVEISGFPLGFETSGEQLQLTWCPSQTPLYLRPDASTRLSRVVFHLFGFFKLHTREVFSLLGSGWVIDLHQAPSIDDVEKASRSDGISRMTHVVELSRGDGSTFSCVEADELLSALKYFFAFVRGTWCDPVCAAGFDSSGALVWNSFSAPNYFSYGIHSWFDNFHPKQMSDLFPLFLTKWSSSEYWKECLREVTYWYVNANTAGGIPGIDVSILLSQAALERLSYQLAVVDRRLISAEGFKSPQLRAADKLRLLLSSLNIPIDTPAATRDIQKYSAIFKWVDGPHAYSSIRNSLVHPDPSAKSREEKFECIHDGWKLGLWYLELALLGIFGYSGSYGNRLTRQVYGRVEPVPWSR